MSTTLLWLCLSTSVILNLFLMWYMGKLLGKLLFISDNLSDLYLTFRSFTVFTKSLYGMEMFYGEPIIQELIEKSKDVLEEIDVFKDVYEYTLDYELEEELDDTEAEIDEEIPS